MSAFTHLDESGSVRMVDVTAKASSERTAVAQGFICMHSQTYQQIRSHGIKKGNVLETARIAGIMAAKRTAELIPMCHPLNITHAQVDFEHNASEKALQITAMVKTSGPTGVEMEALTAVSVAALTIYDMCKAIDRGMTISHICLTEKAGGRSGHFKRQSTAPTQQGHDPL